MESSLDDLQRVVRGCLEAPYHFLKAVTAPMVAAGEGQVLLLTSAAGARPRRAPRSTAPRVRPRTCS